MNKLSLVGGVLHYTPMIYPSQEVKSTTGAVWDKVGKFWSLPCSMANIERLITLHGKENIEFDTETEIVYISKYGFPLKLMEDVTKYIPTSILKILKPYQKDSIQYLYSNPGNSLLSLLPGWGKTLTAIGYSYAIQAKSILVVCPLVLMPQWEEEFKKWGNSDYTVSIVHGDSPTDQMVNITNFNSIEYTQLTPKLLKKSSEKRKQQIIRQNNLNKEFVNKKVDLLIVDESILLKNNDTARYAGIQNIAKTAKKVLFLSGSPTSKFWDDLYAQFSILQPKKYTSLWRFRENYCFLEKTPWGTKVTGSKTNINIQREFRDIMLSFDPTSVEPQLPEYSYFSYNCPMVNTQQVMYNQMLQEFIVQLESGEELSTTSKMGQLVRLSEIVSTPINLGENFNPNSGKTNVLLDLIEANNIVFPAILWTHFKETNFYLNRVISEKYPELRIASLTGSSNEKDRKENITKFKNNELDILILSISSGKYGLNFQNARTSIYYDKNFDADGYFQSLYRIRRLGLKHKPIHISLRTPNSIDDLIEDNLTGKLTSIAQVNNENLKNLLLGVKND